MRRSVWTVLRLSRPLACRERSTRWKHRLHEKARNGLDPREAGDIEFRVRRLEQHVRFAIGDCFDRYADRW